MATACSCVAITQAQSVLGRVFGFPAGFTAKSQSFGGKVQFCSLQAGRQKSPPLVFDQIRELLPVIPDVALAGEIGERGINFLVTDAIIGDLKQAGAGPRTIQVLSTYRYNHSPSVTFNFGQSEVYQGDLVKIYANALDPDGDDLQFFWAASAGEMQGDGSIVSLDTSKLHVGSTPTQVNVSLTVIDRKGGSDSYNKSITVLPRAAASKPYESLTEQEGRPPQDRESQEATIEGKYVVVSIRRQPNGAASSSGFIEVTLAMSGAAVTLRSLTGSLPGKPCRVDVTARENVAEYSFKEPPGSFNAWSSLVMRVRPKDAKKVIRFGIYWQLLDQTIRR